MTIYEYRLVPAPAKGTKARGLKGPEARLARTVETIFNDMAGEGWEFHRAETLPSEERQGLTQSSTVFRTFFVFRRPRAGDNGTSAPGEIGSPAPVADDEPDSQSAQDPSEMEEPEAKETATDPR